MPRTRQFPVTILGALITLLLMFSSATINAQAPAGYYSSATGAGATLKTQLYNIIKGHTVRSYTQLWTDFQQTDKKSNGKVFDMYGYGAYEYTFIDDQCGNYSGEGQCYNREHSFPGSWFNNGSPMYTDLFHLYPTDGYVNGIRSNYPYGVVTNPTRTSANGSKIGPNSYSSYTGTVFEPIDVFKGDFARTYFYMATRYENVIGTWYSNDNNANAVLQNNSFPVFETWFLNMLGEWHVADPVSQKEIDRNNAVYNIQGNRNPFIDNPNYVYQIWGVGQTTNITEPTQLPGNFSANSITLNWTDGAGAAGYLIRYSIIGFNDIQTPLDGTMYSGPADYYVGAGVQTAVIGGLQSNATYYFKLFPYNGNGIGINYKTDSPPQVSLQTGE
jgi:endonuclease I